MHSLLSKVKNNAKVFRRLAAATLQRLKQQSRGLVKRMIGPIEKGFSQAELAAAPSGSYEEIDLSVLPKYICYRAALLREKQTLLGIVAGLAVIFVVQYSLSSFEISRLQERLRLKEYILAPGVVDFTAAAPQTIPDGYITDAVTDFISNLGNVNASTIDEQYDLLKRFMSDRLKIEFDLDTADWVEQVKSDDIAQLFTIIDREIKADDKGWFKATVLARADFYANKAYLGHENHAVEMTLRLQPPESGKRWYIEIETLTWNRETTYRAKQKLSKTR